MTNNNRWVQVLLVELVILATLFLLQQVSTYLLQFANIWLLFFMAWLLSFALRPPIKWLVRRGLPHGGAVIGVYLALLLIIVGIVLVLIPQLTNQLTDLQQNWTGYMKKAEGIVANIQQQVQQSTGQNLDLNSLYDAALAQVQGQAGTILGSAVTWLSTAASLFLNIIFILLIAIYMSVDGERLATGAVNALPQAWRDEMVFVGNSIGRSFGGFLRGQLIFALIYGVLNAGVMIAFGLNYVLVGSIIAGFCVLVPLVGNFLAFIPPMLIVLVTPEKVGQWWLLLLVLFIMQSIMMQVVGPRIMSSAVGIHPLFTFVAMLLGSQLAGLWGVLFGIPVAGVIALVAETLFARLRAFFNAPESAPLVNVVVASPALETASASSEGGESLPGSSPSPSTASLAHRQPALLRGLNWLSSATRNRPK